MSHQIPPKAPPPPRGRVVREGFIPPRELTGAPPFGVELAVVLGIALTAIVMVWVLPKAIEALGERQAVHARALAACAAPGEFEQLHIVVIVRDGRLATECMYLGSRGTYSRKR